MSNLVGNPEARFSHVAAQMSSKWPDEKKNCLLGYPARLDTNLFVKSEKMSKSLKFRI